MDLENFTIYPVNNTSQQAVIHIYTIYYTPENTKLRLVSFAFHQYLFG